MTVTVISVPTADPEHFKQKFVSALVQALTVGMWAVTDNSTAAFTQLSVSSLNKSSLRTDYCISFCFAF